MNSKAGDTNWEILLKSLAAINSQPRLKSLLPTVLDIALGLTGADRAILMLLNEHSHLSHKAGRTRQKKDLSEEELRFSQTIVDRVLNQDQPVYIPLLRKDPEFSGIESGRDLKLKSIICLPLEQTL